MIEIIAFLSILIFPALIMYFEYKGLQLESEHKLKLAEIMSKKEIEEQDEI